MSVQQLLPLPLREGGGGRGSFQNSTEARNRANPSPQPRSASRPKPTRGGGERRAHPPQLTTTSASKTNGARVLPGSSSAPSSPSPRSLPA